jgi:hypothetical protein
LVYDLAHFLHHIIIISPFVGHKATGAILDAALGISEIAAAFIPQRVQRAVTEKAVKIRGIFALMAWEIFALFILKKLIMLHFTLLQILSRDIPWVAGQ